METNKELIVHYDGMKRCRSIPGGFVPPTNTPLAPMRPPKEISFNSSTVKCLSCVCEAHIICTTTVGPDRVSSSVPIVQPSPHTFFVSPPVTNDNLPASSAPIDEVTFPNRSPDSTLPSSSQVSETINSPNCSFKTAVSSTS